MLYLKDLHIGDRFISREYEMTAEEIKKFATQYDPQVFHLDEEQASRHPVFKVWPQVAGTPLQLPCVYGQSAFR